MKFDKKTPQRPSHLPATAARRPVAPPVYRPQPVPRVLQTKAASSHNRLALPTLRTTPFIRSNRIPTAVQLAEGPPSESAKTHQEMRERWRLVRRAGGTPSLTGHRQTDEENAEKARALRITTKTSLETLEKLQAEDWAIRRIGKTRSKVEFDVKAKRGETDPGATPLIKLGNEALTSLPMGRITLRHELDHAKLQHDERRLTLGSFVAYYKKGGERGSKDTFVYELEELIVRLRDWRRFKRERTEPTAEFSGEEAQNRIKEQFRKMCASPDLKEYDPLNVTDIMEKLRAIASELQVALT